MAGRLAASAILARSAARSCGSKVAVPCIDVIAKVTAGVSVEELAEDIARRTLLQGLSVRPILDADRQETGMFEVPAGGRRYRALELLVK